MGVFGPCSGEWERVGDPFSAFHAELANACFEASMTRYFFVEKKRHNT